MKWYFLAMMILTGFASQSTLSGKEEVLPWDGLNSEKKFRAAVERRFPNLEFGFYHWNGDWLIGALEDFENDRILFVSLGSPPGQSLFMRNGKMISFQNAETPTLKVAGSIATPDGTESDFSNPYDFRIGPWIDLEATDTFSIRGRLEAPFEGEIKIDYNPDEKWKLAFTIKASGPQKPKRADAYELTRKSLLKRVLKVLEEKKSCSIRLIELPDVTGHPARNFDDEDFAPVKIMIGNEISIENESAAFEKMNEHQLKRYLEIHKGAADISGFKAIVILHLKPTAGDRDFREVLRGISEAGIGKIYLSRDPEEAVPDSAEEVGKENDSKAGKGEEEVLSVLELYQQGEEHFFAGRFKKAIASWDAEIALEPRRDPFHWQRGLAYYYAGEFEKGVKQFERHQKVNGNDVENAVWHFLCAVRREGGSVEKARKALIPIEGDSRIPMKEVHDLFAGKGTVEGVLKAAGDADDDLFRRNQMCYAHLYLGLYFEALGKGEKSREHLKKAAVDFRMDHYMGKVAQVHFKAGKKAELEK